MGVPPLSLAMVFVIAILLGGGGGSIPANAKVRSPPILLDPDFYASSCPSLERIVRGSMAESMRRSVIVLQAVLRLFFHDCFVEVG
jgi:peroxidase